MSVAVHKNDLIILGNESAGDLGWFLTPDKRYPDMFISADDKRARADTLLRHAAIDVDFYEPDRSRWSDGDVVVS